MAKRPKENPAEVRDCPASFRFTAAELATVSSRAKAAGLTRSEYGRARLLGSGPVSAGKGKGRAAVIPLQAQAQLVLAEQLKRVGVNLNQIARHMNTTGEGPPPELRLLLSTIRNLVREARGPS